MSTSKEYWKRREYQNLLKSKNRDKAFVKGRIAYIYNELLRNINKEIERQIYKFADNEGISIKEARKIIDKTDLEDYKNLAEKYVKNKDLSQKANREMKLYNVTMRVNRLELLSEILRLHIIGAGSKIENELENHLIKGSIDEFKRQAGILGANINDKSIERKAKFIVSQDYHNAHFSDRIWRDTRELSRRIERNIETVVIQGKNPKVFAKTLKDLVKKDIKNITNATERIAFTESGRVWIQTQIQAYKDGGYEYLEILTEPTACHHCSPHNGDIVKISEAIEGDNIPLWHPRCRCTTVAYFDDKSSEKGYDLEDMGYNYNENDEIFYTDDFTIHYNKIYKYLLKKGTNHYQEFKSVGFKEENSYKLLDQLQEGYKNGKKVYDRKNDYTFENFRIDMQLGINKKRNFRTAWSIDRKGDKPRFVTAYRYEKKNK